MATHNPHAPGSWAAAAAPQSQQPPSTAAGEHRRLAEEGRVPVTYWLVTTVALALFAVSLAKGLVLAAVLTGAVGLGLAYSLVIDQRKRAALRRR